MRGTQPRAVGGWPCSSGRLGRPDLSHYKPAAGNYPTASECAWRKENILEELETHSSPPGPGEPLSRRMEQRPLVATVRSCLCEIAAGSAAYLSGTKLMLGTFRVAVPSAGPWVPLSRQGGLMVSVRLRASRTPSAPACAWPRGLHREAAGDEPPRRPLIRAAGRIEDGSPEGPSSFPTRYHSHKGCGRGRRLSTAARVERESCHGQEPLGWTVA